MGEIANSRSPALKANGCAAGGTTANRIVAAGEQSPQEGVAIAVEILQRLTGIAQGAYLMPPFGRYDMAAEIIEALGERMPVERTM